MLSTSFLMSKNGPIQCYWQLFSWVRMGPFKVIDAFPDEQDSAHSMLSATFSWPTQSHRPFSWWARVGPFNAIGHFSHELEWAHSQSSAVFFVGSNGPIQCYRQLFSWVRMGPFKAIGNFSHKWEWAHSRSLTVFFIGRNGPVQCYRQLSHESEWAHSKSSTLFLMNEIGPIHCYRQLFSWVSGPIHSHWQFSSLARMGPFKVIDTFPDGQNWAHSMPSSNFSHEWEWTHSQLPTVFFVSKNWLSAIGNLSHL